MPFASLFVQDSTFSHLNAGTRTRVPLEVLDYIDRKRREDDKNPTKSMFVGYNGIWEVQKRLAAFLGADPHDIFLRGNVTAAFNDFMFALPKLPAGEFLATGWEYGGIVGVGQSWAKVEGHQVRIAPLELRDSWTKEELVHSILSSLSDRTRVLLLSHVATGPGTILPIREIAAAAKEKGVITVVDGAHATGAIPLDLRELDAVDFYGGNFHKWFLGPEGTGFGWVHPRWKEKLVWKFGGWAWDKPPSYYQNFGDKNPETCRRYFPGTIDHVLLLSLGEVQSFWEKHTPRKIRQEQSRLRDIAIESAEKLGWERRSPRDHSLLGPLCCFSRPKGWEGEHSSLATRIYYEAKVQLALPEFGGTKLVRVSPGVYATDEEVRGAFERLAAWKP